MWTGKYFVRSEDTRTKGRRRVRPRMTAFRVDEVVVTSLRTTLVFVSSSEWEWSFNGSSEIKTAERGRRETSHQDPTWTGTRLILVRKGTVDDPGTRNGRPYPLT